MDTSALLENTPLVKFIRNYIRDLMAYFSFPAFSWLFVFGWLFVYIMKKNITC